MNATETMQTLESLGTEQNRKVYRRHGVNGPVFGVSYADMGKLHKKIKVDHGLARELWVSGNHDARVLALFIADPAAADSKTIDAWVKDAQDQVIAGALAHFVAQTSFAKQKMEKWTKQQNEWPGSTGWTLLAIIARQDSELPDDYFEEYLGIIEEGIHKSQNRVRYSMNSAVIAIGCRNAALEKKALAAANRIGKVIVDHGETGCKTPDAVAYIKKAAGRGKKR